MEIKDFETWLDIVSAAVLSQVELQKNGILDHLRRLRGVNQSRHFSRNADTLLQWDILWLFPLEFSFYC